MTVFIGVVGRTMEFTFDQTQISIIGSKYWDIVTSPKLGVTESAITAPASNSGSVSRTTTTTSSDNVSSWKRPASSQVRLSVCLSVCLSMSLLVMVLSPHRWATVAVCPGLLQLPALTMSPAGNDLPHHRSVCLSLCPSVCLSMSLLVMVLSQHRRATVAVCPGLLQLPALTMSPAGNDLPHHRSLYTRVRVRVRVRVKSKYV